MRINRAPQHKAVKQPPVNWDTQWTGTCPSCQTPLHPNNTTTLIYTCTNPNPTIHETHYCTKCWRNSWINDRLICPCGHNIQDWATHTPWPTGKHTTQTSW